MYQAITFGIACLLSAGILFLCRGKNANRLSTILKIFAVAFYAMGFFRFFFTDGFIFVINGGWFSGVRYETTDILQSVLRWGFAVNYAVLVVAVFYESRFFRNIACYVCLPFSVLTTVFFDAHMAYFTQSADYFANSQKNHYYYLQISDEGKYVYFIIELVLALTIPLLLQAGQKHVIRLKDKKEVMGFLLGMPAVVLLSMPPYIPQSLFGYNSLIEPTYGPFHLAWIAVTLIACLGFYYVFRFKSRSERLALCMFLALLFFYTRNSFFLMGINIKRLPFHLCNIAAYFYLIALTMKWKKMFHFAFIANTVGALIAILMPDFSVGAFSFWNTHFLIEHTMVVLVPAMVMGLRIFPRLDFKSLKYAFLGFTIYFFCVFVGGVLLNGYSDITKETVNYFYMFDFEIATDFFPFLEFARHYVIKFGRFSFNPIIVGIIYVMFSLLCLLFFLLVRFFYKMEDDHLALRGSSIDLYEKITHKTSRRPKQFIE